MVILPSPADAKAAAMLSILRQQRDDAANAFVEMAGRCAEWESRWNNPAEISERLKELLPDKPE